MNIKAILAMNTAVDQYFGDGLANKTAFIEMLYINPRAFGLVNSDDHTHTELVELVIDSTMIMDHLRATRKIHAIKILRERTHCGLGQAKNAIEDAAVIRVKNRLNGELP